jgi:2-oxoglutarate ferredoxin oxidoreductase subunit alpha
MRNLSDPEIMHRYVLNPIHKILKKRHEIVQVEADYSGAEIALVSYGTVSRSAKAAAQLARQEGLKVGTLRLVTCWPFPDAEIRQMAESVELVLVLENNTGQIYPYIKSEAAHACRVEFLGPKILGQIHEPEYIVSHIKEMVR